MVSYVTVQHFCKVSLYISLLVFDSLINIWPRQVAEYLVILVGKVIYGKNRQDNKVVKYFIISSLLYLMISKFISPANIAEIP